MESLSFDLVQFLYHLALAILVGGSLILAILTRVLQPPLLVLAHTWLARRKGQSTRPGSPEAGEHA